MTPTKNTWDQKAPVVHISKGYLLSLEDWVRPGFNVSKTASSAIWFGYLIYKSDPSAWKDWIENFKENASLNQGVRVSIKREMYEIIRNENLPSVKSKFSTNARIFLAIFQAQTEL